MKFEYIVVYENSSDKFDIELCRIKVKVGDTIHLPQYKLLLSMYVHLVLIYTKFMNVVMLE